MYSLRLMPMRYRTRFIRLDLGSRSMRGTSSPSIRAAMRAKAWPEGAFRSWMTGDALVGGGNEPVVGGDQAQDIHGKEFHDVVLVQHVPALDHAGADAVDNEPGMLEFRRLQEADYPVGVADGGDFRGGNDNGLAGGADGVAETLFNTGGTVDDDVIEVLLEAAAQVGQLFGADAILVAGLGCGDKV